MPTTRRRVILGTLYKVSDPNTERDIWLAALDVETDNLWVFDPATDRFHLNLGLSRDFAWERDLNYEAIDRETATRLRATKIGRTMTSEMARRHREDGDGIPAGDVLGVSGSVDRRSVLRAKAQSIVEMRPGVWSTWNVYPPGRASAARVCASAMRTGKRKTLTALTGPLESRLVTRGDGSVEVQIAKR